jgi:hypothetical protein
MHPAPLPYLDPGSGSLVIQVIVAALLGIGVALRASWGRIKKVLGGSKSKAGDDDSGK